nr:hypothetical protein [Kofleriaceae bacterium]
MALAAGARGAHAGVIKSDATNIVVESYTGDRYADALRLLQPLKEELVKRGYNSEGVGSKFDATVSRPAIGAKAVPADFIDQVERGYHAWISGKFDDALTILQPLVEVAKTNSAVIADDPKLRDAVAKARIAIALSHLRNGDPNTAASDLGELVRAFPDAVVSRATYGAEAADLYAKVAHDLNAGGRGTLAVKLAGDVGDVFVDERYVGTAIPELTPGEYRVFAKSGKSVSRVHLVTITAGARATLAIDVAFDAAIHTTSWTGLEFAAAADREAHEGEFAQQFATAYGAGAVIVIGIDQVRGRPSVVASLVGMQNGHELRRASVPVEPDPSTDRLRALASYVAGDEPQQGIEVLGELSPAIAAAATAPAAPTTRGSASPWRWVAGVGALAGLGAGGVLLGLDGSCAVAETSARPCSDFRDTKAAGIAVGAAGVALAALTIYLFVHHGESAPTSTAYLAPIDGNTGAVAGYSTLW